VALRKEIIKKRDLITKVKLIRKEAETDKILNKINEMKKDYQDLKDIFEDNNQTLINIVLNPDKLSLTESTRIVPYMIVLLPVVKLSTIKCNYIHHAMIFTPPFQIFPCVSAPIQKHH